MMEFGVLATPGRCPLRIGIALIILIAVYFNRRRARPNNFHPAIEGVT